MWTEIAAINLQNQDFEFMLVNMFAVALQMY